MGRPFPLVGFAVAWRPWGGSPTCRPDRRLAPVSAGRVGGTGGPGAAAPREVSPAPAPPARPLGQLPPAPPLQRAAQSRAALIAGQPSNYQSVPRRQRDAQGGSARAAPPQPQGLSVYTAGIRWGVVSWRVRHWGTLLRCRWPAWRSRTGRAPFCLLQWRRGVLWGSNPVAPAPSSTRPCCASAPRPPAARARCSPAILPLHRRQAARQDAHPAHGQSPPGR